MSGNLAIRADSWYRKIAHTVGMFSTVAGVAELNSFAAGAEIVLVEDEIFVETVAFWAVVISSSADVHAVAAGANVSLDSAHRSLTSINVANCRFGSIDFAFHGEVAEKRAVRAARSVGGHFICV